MLKFYVDKSNLRAAAQHLLDTQRVDEGSLADVETMLRQKLKYHYEGHEPVNFVNDICIHGPVFCLPAKMPGLSDTDVALNLVVRVSDPQGKKWDFDPL